MLDPKQIHEMEQASAAMAESLPPLWWQLYESCKKQGFNDQQSLELVKEFMRGMFTMRGPG